MKIKKNVAISESGFLFNPLSGESYSVNPMGVELFTMLKEGRSAQEIERIVLNRYNVDEATFEKDFQDFIDIMNHYQLLEDE